MWFALVQAEHKAPEVAIALEASVTVGTQRGPLADGWCAFGSSFDTRLFGKQFSDRTLSQ